VGTVTTDLERKEELRAAPYWTYENRLPKQASLTRADKIAHKEKSSAVPSQAAARRPGAVSGVSPVFPNAGDTERWPCGTIRILRCDTTDLQTEGL
jgi:hypothetical protein